LLGLELHPGKVVVIPLWKFVESEVRAAVAIAAPRLAEALIQDYGKLLGIYIGPGAAPRQWNEVREELRSRARFLASLGMAWSGVLPLYRSHVLPVAGHVAAMCPVPKHMLRNEGSCLAVILKTPYRAVPAELLRSGKAFGLGYDTPDLETLGLASTFRAADASATLEQVSAVIGRARVSRYCTLSPFLREWTRKGVVGHMCDTRAQLLRRFTALPPAGKGLQAWVTKEIRKEICLEVVDRSLARRASTMMGGPITIEAAGWVRGRMQALGKLIPPVVQSSVVRSVCNAWTTTGRFHGPSSVCPFGCGAQSGDSFPHFVGCPSFRRMWRAACPNSNIVFENLTLEQALFLSPDLSTNTCVQLALWSDVVGHLSNDIRAMGTPFVLTAGAGTEMVNARLRAVSVLGDDIRPVILQIRAAASA
jgi:hypothetical protein